MYVKPGSDTYLTLSFRYEFVWNQIILFALKRSTQLLSEGFLTKLINDLSKSAK
jgi:hypothetical protein